MIKNADRLKLLDKQLILSALMILPVYFINSNVFPNDFLFWPQIFLIARVFDIIPHFLNSCSLTGVPSSALEILIYLIPIVAFAIAFFYFEEKIDIRQLFAYLLLLLSIVIFNLPLRRNIVTKKQ